MMSVPENTRPTTEPEYELLYHPGIPGRGEYVRLVLEAAGVNYKDPANDVPPSGTSANGYALVKEICSPDSTGDDDGNPPAFAPPALRHYGAGKNGSALVIHQTANIMLYLGVKLGLAGSDEVEKFYVNQIALTALDLSNEVHDSHHPIAVMKYYEEQKDAALARSKDLRDNRLPKFFSYFERVLKKNEAEGKGNYLVGTKLTYADTTLWQVMDGLKFAFPKELEARRKDYPLLFQDFYTGIQAEGLLKSYLNSKKRLPYSMGLFRHYPELDRQ